MAYLGGIDVEVDHRRALLLIEGVAEGGLVEAMEKLVNMYRNGEGVEQNYRTAIEWQANCGIFTRFCARSAWTHSGQPQSSAPNISPSPYSNLASQ